ncbi:MAG: cation-transporting P-type ATPase, partial [Candidatus Gracilibacteria bacterium]
WILQGKAFTSSLLFATSVAVAAVPEGLPATITIALAIGVQRLAKKRAIVKKLSSVETLGSTTTICSDKTGTLTKNEMTVVEVYLLGEKITVKGTGYSPVGEWSNIEHLSKIEPLCRTAVLCNNATLTRTKNTWQIIGDPTEGSLLTAAAKASFTMEKMNQFYKRLYEFPFDSNRKMMTTLDQEKKTHEVTVHLKGAPDEVLKICTHVYEKGKVVLLTPQKRKEIESMNTLMAGRALRVLAFAERPLKATELPKIKKGCDKKSIEKSMVFIGLMGMIDPPRPEVYEAVRLAHEAGIRIIVITGDYGETAYAIAKELKILTRKKIKIITGDELKNISESSLTKLFKQKDYDFVFARVSPEHKLKIVHALKKNGEIVAMTGDGVNDAPALKRADIGVAMGITGTDVSKEAADMVLTDDSFGSIVTAIEEGRTVYNNLKKFVFYIFSGNIGELITIFTAIILNIPAPLTAILILAINLGTDVLPAIALGVEPPESGLMQQAPRSQKEHIIKKEFLIRFFYVGIWIGVIVISMYFWILHRYGWHWGEPLDTENLIYLKASTSSFALLVFIQMANAWNARSTHHSIFKMGMLTNRWLLGAVLISILTVIAFVQISFFQKFLHTTGLSLEEWGLIALAAFTIIVVEEMRKLGTKFLSPGDPRRVTSQKNILNNSPLSCSISASKSFPKAPKQNSSTPWRTAPLKSVWPRLRKKEKPIKNSSDFSANITTFPKTPFPFSAEKAMLSNSLKSKNEKISGPTFSQQHFNASKNHRILGC